METSAQKDDGEGTVRARRVFLFFTGWAVRVGWAGRKAEAQWEGEGKSTGKKKKDWAERPDGLKVTGKILFRIKFDF
jgi:hypothetical protein